MKFFARIWNAMLLASPLRLWVLYGAGPALTVCVAGLVYIVWRGGWDKALQGKQLDYLGATLIIAELLIAVIVLSLARVKVKASGPAGMNFEAEPDSEEPQS